MRGCLDARRSWHRQPGGWYRIVSETRTPAHIADWRGRNRWLADQVRAVNRAFVRMTMTTSNSTRQDRVAAAPFQTKLVAYSNRIRRCESCDFRPHSTVAANVHIAAGS